MKAYVYRVPGIPELKNKYRVRGYVYGRFEIVVETKIDKYEKYFVGEIEVPDNYFGVTTTATKKYTLSELMKFRKNELIKMAEDMGLDTSGTKKEIAERIYENQ